MRSSVLAFAVALAVPAAAQQAQPAGADPRLLFSADDYPAEAQMKGEQGTVQAELTIGSDGRVKACKVIRSSYSASLDTATCGILTRRARFRPARDSNGNPTEDTYVTPPITWLRTETDTTPGMEQVEPGRYHCAPPGKNGVGHDIVPLKPGQEMRVAFQLVRENADAEHPAAAGIMFESASGKTYVLVGRAVNDPFQMYAVLDLPGLPERELYEFPLTKNWIILKLKLDKRGYLTIRNNDQEPRFPIGKAALTGASVHCSSGEWNIDVWPRSYAPAQAPNVR